MVMASNIWADATGGLGVRALFAKLRNLKKEIKTTLVDCQKTLEMTSKALADHFRRLPPGQLHNYIAARFELWDKDHSGELDREELREAFASLGTRLGDAELDEVFAKYDSDGNGTIALEEFEQMVRLSMGLDQPNEQEAEREAVKYSREAMIEDLVEDHVESHHEMIKRSNSNPDCSSQKEVVDDLVAPAVPKIKRRHSIGGSTGETILKEVPVFVAMAVNKLKHLLDKKKSVQLASRKASAMIQKNATGSVANRSSGAFSRLASAQAAARDNSVFSRLSSVQTPASRKSHEEAKPKAKATRRASVVCGQVEASKARSKSTENSPSTSFVQLSRPSSSEMSRPSMDDFADKDWCNAHGGSSRSNSSESEPGSGHKVLSSGRTLRRASITSGKKIEKAAKEADKGDSEYKTLKSEKSGEGSNFKSQRTKSSESKSSDGEPANATFRSIRQKRRASVCAADLNGRSPIPTRTRSAEVVPESPEGGSSRRHSVSSSMARRASDGGSTSFARRRSSDVSSSQEPLPPLPKGAQSPGVLPPLSNGPQRCSTASSSDSGDSSSARLSSSSGSRPESAQFQSTKDPRFESVRPKYLENMPRGKKFCEQEQPQPKVEMPARPRRLSVVTLGL